MSEFVKLKKEQALREEQRPRMFWVQSLVLVTITVYYFVIASRIRANRDFFFFFFKISQIKLLLCSELSSL